MLGCRMAAQEAGSTSFPPTPVPFVHSSASAHHYSSTPKPWPPTAPVFWVGKSLWNKTKRQLRKLCQSATVGMAVPGQLQGGDPGWWGWLLTEARLLSCKCCLCRWPMPPDKLVLGLWEEGRKRRALPRLPGVGTGSHPWGFRSQGQSTLRLICLRLIKRRLYN